MQDYYENKEDKDFGYEDYIQEKLDYINDKQHEISAMFNEFVNEIAQAYEIPDSAFDELKELIIDII